MQVLPQAMQKLIRELSKLPSIGEKSATRLAYFLVNGHQELACGLADALRDAASGVKLCPQCFYFSEGGLCNLCGSGSRERALLCVVEKPMDVIAIERVGEYRGLYHVLHGLWAPLRGLGPESMKIIELMERLKSGAVQEVIIATSSTVEGDATALYVARLIADFKVKSTRIAQGIPKGGELEYADDVTLSRAFAGRGVVSG